MRIHGLLLLLVLASVTFASGDAFGGVFVGSTTNPETGTELSARAIFSVDASGNLLVTLTNTGANAEAPSDILTALFFDVDATLTPMTALLGPGSTVIHGDTPADGNVGGEWAFGSGLSGAPGGATKGISAVGFGLFGSANFNGPVLFTPPPGHQLDGLDAGLVSANQTDIGSNQGVTKTPLLKDTVMFTLDVEGDFDVNAITNVSFQFGTDLSLPNVPGQPEQGLPPDEQVELIPEPGSMAVWMLACCGLGIVVRRRRLKRAPA